MCISFQFAEIFNEQEFDIHLTNSLAFIPPAIVGLSDVSNLAY